MARRALRSRSRSNDRSGLVWTAAATFGTLTIADNGDFTFPVVDVANDLALVGQVQCTLLRIRGYVSFINSDPNTAGERLIMGGAAVVDDSEVALIDWRDITTYTREDVLWTGGAQVALGSTISTEMQPELRFDIDIKSKRRLRSGQSVVVSFRYNGPATTEMTVAGALRALVKLR